MGMKVSGGGAEGWTGEGGDVQGERGTALKRTITELERNGLRSSRFAINDNRVFN